MKCAQRAISYTSATVSCTHTYIPEIDNLIRTAKIIYRQKKI